MKRVYIAAAHRHIDGFGDPQGFFTIEELLVRKNVRYVKCIIDPLSVVWDSPLDAHHYRSGCGPLEALHDAKLMITRDVCPCVIIEGEDMLKTGYERHERHRLMLIYGERWTLPEAYTELSKVFMKRWNMDTDSFKRLAGLLFENYMRTASNAGPRPIIDEKWYEFVTDLFRGVDCANPRVDFSGRILVCNEDVADLLNIPENERITLIGTGLGILPHDGPEYVNEIASYDHLRSAFQDACMEAGIDFPAQFLSGRALLEVYTCYPVVPLAFLLTAGIVSSPDKIEELLKKYEVTVTGGMNLGRAPWNNASLNALVVMYYRLRECTYSVGLVHGNGGLGSRQGVAILEKSYV